MLEEIGIISRKLKQGRLAIGLTQGQLAERCNVSRSLISSIENGYHSPSLAVVIMIAQTLGITLEIPPRGRG